MMTNREQKYTKVSAFATRLKVWQEAIQAAENHVKLGATLQGQGVEILRNSQGVNPEDIAKATATIEKGVKLERDARDKLIALYQHQPKE